MPKVLRIINRFNVGGPIYNATYLSKYLEPDFETFLIGGPAGPNEESSLYIPEKLGIHAEIIPEMSREIGLHNDWTAYQKIKKIIGDFKPDIVHTHASKAGFLGRMAAHQLNVNVIVHTFHGNIFDGYFGKFKTTVFKNIERHLAKKTNCIIALSQAQKDDLAYKHKICAAPKIEIIPLGFDLSRFNEDKEVKRQRFRDTYLIEEDELVIVMVGRLVPIKNHVLFLDVIKKLTIETQVKIRAFVIGDGELKMNLINYCHAINLDVSESTINKTPATISFTSWIREVDEVYAGSDIVMLTSLNEGTPVSLIEAMASGKPIVSTNVGGIENIVMDGETALLSKVDEQETLYQNLKNLATDSELRKKLTKNSWEHVREKFHYTRLVNDVGELYHKLLSEKKGS